jgi:alkylation response protein AidB-like acyl-CoA dehydrogenase
VKTEQNGSIGFSFLLIDRDTEGFSVGKIEKKMGFRGSPFTELIFEDAKVPKSQLLGEPGTGLQLARKLLSYTRTGVAAWAIGNAQGALETAIAYIKVRPQFGQLLSEFQAIRFMVVEMKTKIEVARSLIYRIASLVDSGFTDVITLVSMAKWYSTDVGMEVTTNSIQIMGAHGYTQEYPVERMMRDAKGFQVLEGTNEIQKVIIAESILD